MLSEITEQLLSSELAVLPAVYHELLHAYIELNDSEFVLDFFNHLRSQEIATAVAYRLCILSVARSGNLEKAHEILEEMQQTGKIHSVHTNKTSQSEHHLSHQ